MGFNKDRGLKDGNSTHQLPLNHRVGYNSAPLGPGGDFGRG